MASGPARNNDPTNSTDPAKIKQALIPTLVVCVIIAVVAVIVGFYDSSLKMSDGSNGTVDDPDLKEILVGVKYRDLKEGSGEACPANTRVKMNYTGWLPDGTEFDSGNNKEFNLNSLIQGWQAGIPGMKPGGIRKLVISPEKGYGAQSKGKIPANSTLIFEVQLLSFAELPDLDNLSDKTAPGADDPNLKEIVPGVKYRDIREGNGPPCPHGASVTIHYTGWLVKGTRFDSSREKGIPAKFELKDLIKGWQEGIPGMKPGGIRKLVISPEMGYGSQQKGSIPANSTLVFEVELFEAN